MKKILYVYGYGGSATGSTVTMLKRLMPEGYTVEAFTYTQADCAKAREEIFDYIREHEIDLVIGSSLGAFITHTLQGMPRILVNPCWLPSVELPKIGAPAELVATYAPFEQWAEEHAAEDSTHVHAFFADEDELLGDKYVSEFLRHYPEQHCHRIHSGHHLSEEGARVIIAYLQNMSSCVGETENRELKSYDRMEDMSALNVSEHLRKEPFDMDDFLVMIGREELLTVEDEKQLIIKAREGNCEARNQLQWSYARFVVSLSAQYQQQGLTMQQLLMVGFTALDKAIDTYDVASEKKPIHYAVPLMRQAIEHSVNDRGSDR